MIFDPKEQNPEMGEHDDLTRELNRARKIVAALWRPDLPLGPDGDPLLTDEQTREAAVCVAWAVGQVDITTEETNRVIDDILVSDPNWHIESWKLTAYAMEVARDRACALRDILADIAAASAILLCYVEDNAAADETELPREAKMLGEALARYSEARGAT